MPKETTVTESHSLASNLEPCDYQADARADALMVCYCLPNKMSNVVMQLPYDNTMVTGLGRVESLVCPQNVD